MRSRRYLCVFPPIVARQRLKKRYSSKEYTRNNRIIVGRVVFNVGSVVSMKVGD
jgi:hypothetical protein